MSTNNEWDGTVTSTVPEDGSLSARKESPIDEQLELLYSDIRDLEIAVEAYLKQTSPVRSNPSDRAEGKSSEVDVQLSEMEIRLIEARMQIRDIRSIVIHGLEDLRL